MMLLMMMMEDPMLPCQGVEACGCPAGHHAHVGRGRGGMHGAGGSRAACCCNLLRRDGHALHGSRLLRRCRVRMGGGQALAGPQEHPDAVPLRRGAGADDLQVVVDPAALPAAPSGCTGSVLRVRRA